MSSSSYIFSLPKSLSALEEEIRAQLSGSINHIVEQVGQVQPFDQDVVASLCNHVRTHRVDPAVFARYQDVLHRISEHSYEDIPGIIGEMHDIATETATLEIVKFSQETLGNDMTSFTRIVFSSDFGSNPIRDPGEEPFQKSKNDLLEALSLIEQIAPEAFEEIQTFWSRIWVGLSPMEPGVRHFAGVTSFLLWGGSFMNSGAQANRIDCADYLVHEITHSLLFTLSASEPLVLNRLEERYPSPLRQDPRPMDGIYHATLVCGRLLVFFRQALDSRLLSEEERTRLKGKLQSVGTSYQDGMKTVEEFGKLSERGRALLDELHAVVKSES